MTSSLIFEPSFLVLSVKISWQVSISSCPVKKTRISPRGWVTWIWPISGTLSTHQNIVFNLNHKGLHFPTFYATQNSPYNNSNTVVPGFSILGFRALPWFRALNAGNQIWFYTIDLPGFSALPGFKAPFYGDGQSALNPGTTVFSKNELMATALI